MKELLEKIIKNGISVLLVKFMSVFHILVVANFYSKDELAQYSYLISFIVFYGTTFTNVISPYFSVKNNDSTVRLTIVSIQILLAIITCLLIFKIEETSFYITLFIVVFSTIGYSFFLDSSQHGKLAKLSFIGIVTSLISSILCVLNEVSVENYLLVYAIPYFIFSINIFNNKFSNRLIISANEIFSTFLLYFSNSLIPLSIVLVYQYLKISGLEEIIGEYSTLFQWTFIFGQASIIFNNTLVKKNKQDYSISKSVSNDLILSLSVPLFLVILITPITYFHNNIFNLNIPAKELKLSLFFILSVAYLSNYKSHIYRRILRSDKVKLSFYSNLSWVVIYVTTVYFNNVKSIADLAGLFFFTNYLVFIVFIPIYLRQDLIEINNRISITLTATAFLIVYIILSVFLYLEYLTYIAVDLIILGLIFAILIKNRKYNELR
ncbi:hypothetical protein Q4520_08380 [Alteromonas sp. 1_MG-2023]|uniref:hypothetical protein n=1 Tax=Alteromonas sp. 1_MG-2023 TaxID=3062669 RepID=UPI0026E31065|nr:hypothetical protein [Alteromonas sp. 1_MG-2023]MDO6475435.1 hypothetical protein [Alteromonas sp. 1_MG-2023]